jgi:hypothetical protein
VIIQLFQPRTSAASIPASGLQVDNDNEPVSNPRKFCTREISNRKSACGKVSQVRHMVPGGSWESLPKRKVRFADHPEL